VSSNLTMITVLVSVIHVAVLAIMIWIRVRRTEGDGLPAPAGGTKTTPCAICGAAATEWTYDGLDPNEQRDTHTGRAWSADISHYRPVCQDHEAIPVPVCQ
jgi:hypothetical protein